MTGYAILDLPHTDEVADQCNGVRHLCAEGWNFRYIYEDTLRDFGDDEEMVLQAYDAFRFHVRTCEPVEGP